MTSSVATAQLEHTLFLRASAAQCWDALTNGEQTARYYYGSPVESSWQPGAEVHYFAPDRASVLVRGTVVSVEPERRLVLRLRLLYDPASAAEAPFEQTWTIEPMGAVCKLTVVHSTLDPTGASYQQIAGGMPLITSSLKSLLETGEGLPMG